MNLQYQISCNKKSVNIELLTGRVACISSSSCVTEDKVNGKIVALNYLDELQFGIKDVLEFKINNLISKFEIKKIIPNEEKGRYYLICEEDNYTNYFILPLITNNIIQNKDWFAFHDFFINSYLNENLDSVYIIVRYFHTDKFRDWEKKIKQSENYIGQFDPTPYFVGYKFKISDIYRNDLELFLDGKYSQISEQSKKKILRFHKASNKGNLYGILYKTETRKSALEQAIGVKIPNNIDLENKPNLDNEIYRGIF